MLKLDTVSGSTQELLRAGPGEAGVGGLDVDSNGNLYVVQSDSYYDTAQKQECPDGGAAVENRCVDPTGHQHSIVVEFWFPDGCFGGTTATIYALKPGRGEPETILAPAATTYGIAVGPTGTLNTTDADHVFEIPVP